MRVLLWLFFPRSVRGQETRSVPPSSRHMAHEFTFVTSSPAILFAFGLGVRPLGRKRPLGLFATLCPPVARRRDDGSITPSAARQPSYDSTKPTQLLQTPALIVSRRGHVGPCGMLDHRPHAPREILCEFAGCGAGALGRIRAHWCAWVAGVIASGTVGHFDPSELEVSVACGNRLPPPVV
jgi:hypothetical protein